MAAANNWHRLKAAARSLPPGSLARRNYERMAANQALLQASKVSRVNNSWALPIWISRAQEFFNR